MFIPLRPAVVASQCQGVWRHQHGLCEPPFHAVYTELSLENVGTGLMASGRIVPKDVGPVEEEYLLQVEAYQKAFSAFLGTQAVDIIPDAEDTPAGDPEGTEETAAAQGLASPIQDGARSTKLRGPRAPDSRAECPSPGDQDPAERRG